MTIVCLTLLLNIRIILTMAITNSPIEQKRGTPLPLGATVVPDGINFAIFSRHATKVELVIATYDSSGSLHEQIDIPLDPELNKTGDIWHILLPIYWRNIRYGYRISGPDSMEQGTRYSREHILIDPYCRKLVPRTWGEKSDYGRAPCCMIPGHRFDWQNDRRPKIPLHKSIIYELHVRGFTISETANVAHPGSYRAIVERIPYLKSLGITAVELMPVAEFDENDTFFTHPETGKKLRNLWGYNSANFLLPNHPLPHTLVPR